jgi:hypothetical protein
LTKLKNRVGKTLTVLVDAPGVGRSKADAPEIDGVVRFEYLLTRATKSMTSR